MAKSKRDNGEGDDERVAALEAEVKALCNRAKEILLEESNVQNVESPVTVSFCLMPNLKLFLVTLMLTFPSTDLRRHPRPVLRFERTLHRWR